MHIISTAPSTFPLPLSTLKVRKGGRKAVESGNWESWEAGGGREGLGKLEGGGRQKGWAKGWRGENEGAREDGKRVVEGSKEYEKGEANTTKREKMASPSPDAVLETLHLT